MTIRVKLRSVNEAAVDSDRGDGGTAISTDHLLVSSRNAAKFDQCARVPIQTTKAPAINGAVAIVLGLNGNRESESTEIGTVSRVKNTIYSHNDALCASYAECLQWQEHTRSLVTKTKRA